MQNFGVTSLMAGAMTAGVVGLAAPAQADIGHHIWVDTITQPHVYVPHADTTVHHCGTSDNESRTATATVTRFSFAAESTNSPEPPMHWRTM
jgi:hypothetical protein